jgi:metallo-beta-lactamase family protein
VSGPDLPSSGEHAVLAFWLTALPSPPDACLVVHGEPEASQVLADRVERELDWLA